MDVYRHGDVLIAPVESIPEFAEKQPDLVLARGEATGHAHRVETEAMAEVYSNDGNLFLRVVGSPANVVHEEHHTIQLPVGDYRVWRQREYDPKVHSRTIQD